MTVLFEIPHLTGLIPKNIEKYYSIVVWCIILAAIIALSYNKPKFIRVLERDIESRLLSVWEEMLLWTIGLWLLIYNSTLSFLFQNISDSMRIYLGVSNFCTAFAIVLLVVDSNYRKYYYTTNMKLQKSLITTMADLGQHSTITG